MKALCSVLSFFLWVIVNPVDASSKHVDHTFESKILKESIHNIPIQRKTHVFLPEGYAESKQRYPVIYYLRSLFANHDGFFESGDVKRVFDTAMNEGIIPPTIIVFPDFDGPPFGSFYQNHPVSGRWLDYLLDEVIPEVDTQYRTLSTKRGRGVTGDFFGAYAAIKVNMLYPGYFNAAYALHPVATGAGYIPIVNRPPWEDMANATSFDDLDGNIFGQVFLAMAQAYLPNKDNPPFFADLVMNTDTKPFTLNPQRAETLRKHFLLEEYPLEHFLNLNKLEGFMMDWARYDRNQDHVLSNERLSRMLDSRGINHRAEEYRGAEFEHHWSLNEHGRVYNEVLPFFRKYLDYTTVENEY